jgi:hypothetical protein
MKISRRVAIACLVGAILLWTGLLFWPFLLNNVIKPTALVSWLLLRILVLSIDQHYYWYALILVVAIFLFRVLSYSQETVRPDVYQEANTTLDNIEYWHVRFSGDSHNGWDEKILKRDLLHLLLALYALDQNTSNNFELYQAVQQGGIPLPEHIHAFLFPQEPRESDSFIIRFLESIQETPRNWIHRWTGQARAEQFQRITEILSFIETSLEITNDDRDIAHYES